MPTRALERERARRRDQLLGRHVVSRAFIVAHLDLARVLSTRRMPLYRCVAVARRAPCCRPATEQRARPRTSTTSSAPSCWSSRSLSYTGASCRFGRPRRSPGVAGDNVRAALELGHGDHPHLVADAELTRRGGLRHAAAEAPAVARAADDAHAPGSRRSTFNDDWLYIHLVDAVAGADGHQLPSFTGGAAEPALEGSAPGRFLRSSKICISPASNAWPSGSPTSTSPATPCRRPRGAQPAFDVCERDDEDVEWWRSTAYLSPLLKSAAVVDVPSAGALQSSESGARGVPVQTDVFLQRQRQVSSALGPFTFMPFGESESV